MGKFFYTKNYVLLTVKNWRCMLNPEYIDWEDTYGNSVIKVGFSDDNAEPVIEITLSLDDAMKLSKMLQESTNMKARIAHGYLE